MTPEQLEKELKKIWKAICCNSGSSTFEALTDGPGDFIGNELEFLRVNAAGTALEYISLPGGGDALTTDPLSQFASTTSAQLAGVLSDETGTGLAVFNTSPLLATPRLAATSTIGHVWTATDGSGNGSFQAASGGMTNPLTTTGDIIYSSSGTTPARLGIGATNEFLTVQGGLPVWDSINLVVTPAGTGEAVLFDLGTDILYHKAIGNSTFISASTAADTISLTLSATGTPDSTTFLCGDNTWKVPAGGTFSTGLTDTAGTITANISTGVSGGQTIIGGTASGDSLTYSSTSNATKGTHIWGTTSKMWFHEANNKLYVGQATDLGTFGIQAGVAITVGRAQATPISKFTFSNNTTGSAGIGFYTSTDQLLGLFRSSGPSIGTTLSGISKNNMTELATVNGPLMIGGTNQPIYLAPNTTAPAISIITAGRVGLNAITAPTAWLHLPAGTTAASTAPLKLTSGTNMTTPEAGSVEFDGTNYFVTSSTTRYTLAKTLTATATLDFDLTAVNYQDLTITVTGAADGDAVIIGVPNGSVVADVIYFGWVSAANTVSIRASRVGGGGAADPASGTFRASVIKY